MEDKAVNAQILDILGKTGSRGGITQVRVSLIDPNSGQPRQLIRNVKGAVKKGDTLSLMECEREARRLRWENTEGEYSLIPLYVSLLYNIFMCSSNL